MDHRVTAAISFMIRQLANRVSIFHLSRSVNLTPARLRQLFKAETGRSPRQYLKELRLQKAEELLEMTFLSVKEIAFACGVNDVSHFIRLFKEKHGLTPRKFRVRSRDVGELSR